MLVIDDDLLNKVSNEAKTTPRMRKNYNFHQSLDEKCHRFLNALEPETVIDIHRHPSKDETFILLRGKVAVLTYSDDGNVIEKVVLSLEEGQYGVNIPKGVWHKVESLVTGSVIFECKEGPFVPHEEEGILKLSKI